MYTFQARINQMKKVAFFVKSYCVAFREPPAVGGGGGREEGYSHILAIRVCAAGKGMVFKPFTLG